MKWKLEVFNEVEDRNGALKWPVEDNIYLPRVSGDSNFYSAVNETVVLHSLSLLSTSPYTTNELYF